MRNHRGRFVKPLRILAQNLCSLVSIVAPFVSIVAPFVITLYCDLPISGYRRTFGWFNFVFLKCYSGSRKWNIWFSNFNRSLDSCIHGNVNNVRTLKALFGICSCSLNQWETFRHLKWIGLIFPLGQSWTFGKLPEFRLLHWDSKSCHVTFGSPQNSILSMKKLRIKHSHETSIRAYSRAFRKHLSS